MKKASESKTIQTAAAMVTAAVTTLVLHYTGALVVDGPAVGAAWSAVVSSVIMVALRLITREPIGTKEEVPE